MIIRRSSFFHVLLLLLILLALLPPELLAVAGGGGIGTSLKKLWPFGGGGRRTNSEPQSVGGGGGSRKGPLRRANSAPAAAPSASVLHADPISSIELVNLLAMPEMYEAQWEEIGPEHVVEMKAMGSKRGETVARIRKNIRNAVDQLGSRPVKALHDKAEFMAPTKRYDLALLYSLLTLGVSLSGQLERVSDDVKDQIRKRSGILRKWFNKWPKAEELHEFDDELARKRRDLARWAKHLETLLRDARVVKMKPKELKAKFDAVVRVDPIKNAEEAKEFLSFCGLAVNEQEVKQRVRKTDLNRQPESKNIAWAGWAMKASCKAGIGGTKMGKKVKGDVPDLGGLDLQACENIKRGDDASKIAEKIAPRLKKTVEEVDQSERIQKELRKHPAQMSTKSTAKRIRTKRAAAMDEYADGQYDVMAGYADSDDDAHGADRRRVKRGFMSKRHNKKRRGGKKHRFNAGLRYYNQLRPFASQFLPNKPGEMNALSPGSRVRANRRNPRRHKRGVGRIIYCTIIFILALFLALNTIAAFFAIFSPWFLGALVLTLILAMLTGALTSHFMGYCGGRAMRYGYGGRDRYGYGGYGGRDYGAYDRYGYDRPRGGGGGYAGQAPPEIYLLQDRSPRRSSEYDDSDDSDDDDSSDEYEDNYKRKRKRGKDGGSEEVRKTFRKRLYNS